MMVLPNLSPGPDPVWTPPAVDFRSVTLSPAAAIANLEKVFGKDLEVDRMNLRRLHDTVVYEVGLKSGGSHQINAVSGQVFTMTPELAEQIVRDTFPTQARVLQIDRIGRYTYSYQWGPLPAYEIVLENEPSAAYYVSVQEGTVRRSDRWNRIQGALASLHTFQPLKLVTTRDPFRRGLLVIVAIVGLAVAITGYCLALRRT